MDEMYIVIPALNEENTIANCVNALSNQIDLNFTLVLVDNGSDDGTVSEFEDAARAGRLDHAVVREKEKSNIAARAAGARFIEDKYRPTDADVFCFLDADTLVSEDWTTELRRHYSEGATTVATLGSFFSDFLLQCKNMVVATHNLVGDIHFSDSVVTKIVGEGKVWKRKKLYFDFYTPTKDMCASMTRGLYWQGGGYKRRFDASGKEVLHETLSLLCRAAQVSPVRSAVANAWFETSPRRYVRETTKFLLGRSYDGGMVDYRGPLTSDEIAAFDSHFSSPTLNNMVGTAIKHYILTALVLDPAILTENASFFSENLPSGRIRDALRSALSDVNLDINLMRSLDRIYREFQPALDQSFFGRPS